MRTLLSPHSGCFVGYDASTHYRYVPVSKDFVSPTEMLHKVFHILGRYHEHQRPDRVEYVRVMWANVMEGTYIPVTHAMTSIIMHTYTYVRALVPISKMESTALDIV